MSPPAPPIALTIAGSDSGGGAGVQADLKTFHAFGVFGTSAITAVTAQNTRRVHAVHPIPADTVYAQIDAVATDLPPSAVKTGMLLSADLTRTVARALGEHAMRPYVLDPVMVATSGDRLLEEDAVASIVEELLPLADLATPNLHEAGILARMTVASPKDMRAAAERIMGLGAKAVLVKGGHLAGDPVDLLLDAAGERVWSRPRFPSDHTHGSGCTLSAAVTAGLACGADLRNAVDRAVRFVDRAIREAPEVGHGRGPVNHFVDTD